MGPHGERPGESGPERTGQPRHRAGFREERDRLVVANGLVGLAFSTLASGTLVSVQHRPTHTEFLHGEEAAAEGYLWRLGLVTNGGARAWVSNRLCRQFGHRVEAAADGSLELRLIWSGLQAGAEQVEGEVVASWTVPAHGGTVVGQLLVRLPSHVQLFGVEFPCVCAVGASDPRVAERLVLPISEGMLIPEPRGMVTPAAGPRWAVRYPGEASVQLVAFSCGEATLALACHDATGSEKVFGVGGMARSNRLAMWVATEAIPDGEGSWSLGFPAAVSVVGGDWVEAAREYRQWAAQQPWCGRGRGGLRNLPAVLETAGLWVSFWGGPRAVGPVLRDLQRVVAAPLRLDWRCWHGCARGGAYPDYFPPREGLPVFAEAVEQVAESGVVMQLSFHGLMASAASHTWQVRGLASAAAEEPVGQDPSPLVMMCALTEEWQQVVADTARGIRGLGATGVYVEGLSGGGWSRCRRPEHGHQEGRDQVGRALRAVLSAARGPLSRGEAYLAADGLWEGALDIADVFITRDCAAERTGVFVGAEGRNHVRGPGFTPLVRWVPVPLFGAIYHPYTTLVGYGISLVNNQPYDPQWPAEKIASLHEPEDLMSRDFVEQFYVEVARAVVSGKQLMVTNLTQRQLRDDSARRKLAFVRAALQAQAWGEGKLLPFCDLVGLLRVEAEPLELEMLVNPEDSEPEARHVVRRRQEPVLGSVWAIPGGGVTVLLVNLHREAVEFAAPLGAAANGLPARARELAGRTFSPDSEAPPALLRVSGSELSGRLPGHSVFLVALR